MNYGLRLPMPELMWRVSHSMSSLVLGQGGAVCEGLPTVPALKRPLSGVDPPVLSEVSALFEAFPTIWTLVGLFSGVCPLVLAE